MMAMDKNFLFPHQPSLANWDPQPFGVGDLHEQQHLKALAVESPMSSSEASTGYLQDALAGWSSGSRGKRRRVGTFPVHDLTMNEDFHDLLQEFWNSEFYGSTLDNSGHQFHDNFAISDDPFNLLLNSKGPTTAPELLNEPLISSFFSSNKEIKLYSNDSVNGEEAHQSKDSKASSPSSMAKELTFQDCEERRQHKKKKKEATMGVAYPFAVVKPGGLDGDVTLADINARILMRPRRPVRHPVGEYACGPCVAADGGPGLSGKAVVSLTTIQTRGRGTITIIRTRG